MGTVLTDYHALNVIQKNIMSQRPKRTKPDGNQNEIVTDLRKLGFDVEDVHDLPGIYDIVVSGYKDQSGWTDEVRGAVCSVRVEIKSEKGKLSPGEKEFHDAQNYKGSLIVAKCTEDILAWFGQ